MVKGAKMQRLIEVAFIIAFLILIAWATSGCATLDAMKRDNVIEQEVPTPGEQLWTAAKKSNWLVTLSILGVAVGIFALSNGATKLGIATITSSCVSLFMTLAVARYAAWMAVFGLIGSVAAALFSILARRRALVEIIKGVQKFKDRYGEQSASRQNLSAKLSDTSSKVTETIVSKLKSELRLKGQI